MPTRRFSMLAMLLAVVAAALVGSLLTAAVDINDDSSALMKRKLKHSQDILEGLAIEDFAKIRASAKELVAISQETQWKAIQAPQYATLAAEFRAAVAKLDSMAEAKNLDGATLGFVKVTLSCVDCHKLVRDQQKVAQAAR